MLKLPLPVILFANFISLASCTQNEEITLSDEAFIVFGHFYGMCIGESCVEIFRLEEERLLEDINDLYPSQGSFYEGNFVELGDDKYQLVNDLMDFFPEGLLEESKIQHGCPDCADQGGLYIEYKSNEIHKYWILDQSKASVPDYMHEFMDKVNEKIDIINE